MVLLKKEKKAYILYIYVYKFDFIVHIYINVYEMAK